MKAIPLLLSVAAVLAAGHGIAAAEDSLKVAVSQRGAWDTAITEIGNPAARSKGGRSSVKGPEGS